MLSLRCNKEKLKELLSDKFNDFKENYNGDFNKSIESLFSVYQKNYEGAKARIEDLGKQEMSDLNEFAHKFIKYLASPSVIMHAGKCGKESSLEAAYEVLSKMGCDFESTGVLHDGAYVAYAIMQNDLKAVKRKLKEKSSTITEEELVDIVNDMNSSFQCLTFEANADIGDRSIGECYVSGDCSISYAEC